MTLEWNLSYSAPPLLGLKNCGLTIFKEQRKWHLTETKTMTWNDSRREIPSPSQSNGHRQESNYRLWNNLWTSQQLASHLLKDPTLSKSQTHDDTSTKTHLTSNDYLFIYTNTTDWGEGWMMKCYSKVANNVFLSLREIHELNVLPSPAGF